MVMKVHVTYHIILDLSYVTFINRPVACKAIGIH